ncbi:hypothetical protein R1flu_027036 [Riccia fluitans]|uniref:Uncharacterized protein n=1 Tax=Riccia fluitans TaxID=41844 RepID=A0ABD1XIC7_9MARC
MSGTTTNRSNSVISLSKGACNIKTSTFREHMSSTGHKRARDSIKQAHASVRTFPSLSKLQHLNFYL